MKDKPNFESIFKAADLAGNHAGSALNVGWYPCGFAWVTLKPANSPAANWVKKHGEEIGIYSHKAYGGGLEIWIRDHEQSMVRKETHAKVMAEVLVAHGIPASWGSRID